VFFTSRPPAPSLFLILPSPPLLDTGMKEHKKSFCKGRFERKRERVNEIGYLRDERVRSSKKGRDEWGGSKFIL
jgi:hypothetical protein